MAETLQGLLYMDRTRFREEQQDSPPKGFCSSDFMRRGEFTSTIRTEQYRDMLKACVLADLHHPCRAMNACLCMFSDAVLQGHHASAYLVVSAWHLQHPHDDTLASHVIAAVATCFMYGSLLIVCLSFNM